MRRLGIALMAVAAAAICSATATPPCLGDSTDTGAGLSYSALAWGDYDNDGDPDLAIAGWTDSRIYRNDDGGFAIVEASITVCGQTIKQRIQVDFLQEDADDWPMFMHDPRHQGYSRFYDTVNTEDLTEAWHVDVDVTSADHYETWGDQHPQGGPSPLVIFQHPYIDSSPVHAAGCPVIVGGYIGDYFSSTGYVKAFDPTTGVNEWRFPSDDEEFIGGVASTPAIFSVGEQKRVVFGSMDGKVYCLRVFAEGSDAAGSLIWSYQTRNRDEDGNGAILASPVVYDGRVYIGNESSWLYCLDGTTNDPDGDLMWKTSDDDLPIEGTWKDRTGLSSVAIGPTVSGETRAYVGSDNGHVYCLSLEDNPQDRVIWTYPDDENTPGLGCIESSPTVYAGNVYVGTSNCDLDFLALDAETGKLLWTQGLNDEARGTAACADNRVYVGVDTGTKFYSMLAPDGSDRCEYDAGNYFVGSPAIMSAGFVYVGNDNGYFYKLVRPDLPVPGTQRRYTAGVVASSPAISYVAGSSQPGRWIFFTSRGDDGRGDGIGTLFGLEQTP